MSPANSAAIESIWSTDFAPLVSNTRKQLRGTAQAEDVVSQAFTKLAELMERRLLPDPRAMLRVITHGLTVDAIRDAANAPLHLRLGEREVDLEQDTVGGTHAFTTIEESAFGFAFDQAVRALPEQERDAYILTELRGLPIREAAEHLGMSKSDVDRRASSARTTIRKELAA